MHFPVIVFWNYTPFEGTNLASVSVWGIAGIVLITAILSIALHHLVEIRTRNVLSLARLTYVGLGACLCVMLFAFLALRLSSTLFSIEELNISNALNDRDFLQCENSMAITSSTLSSCEVNGLAGNGEGVERIGQTDKRFLLHGDSHADGIKLALAEVLAQANHSLRITGEYAAVNLLSNNDAVIEEAVAQDIDVIILHSLAQADYGAALEGFISEAETHGIHVAFIAPVPTYEYDVPKKLALDYRHGRTLDRRGSLLVEHQEKNRQLFAVLERLQRNQESFSWYQSADYLCDEYCYISADNWIPYYFYTNHLTLTGVRLLAPIFELVSEL